MAASDKVEVNPEHLLGGDGKPATTLQMAMTVWSRKNGPVTYNKWQSLYFALIRMDYKDELPAEMRTVPPQAGQQARIRQLYNDIQREVHGSDYLALSYVKAGAGVGSAVVTASSDFAYAAAAFLEDQMAAIGPPLPPPATPQLQSPEPTMVRWGQSSSEQQTGGLYVTPEGGYATPDARLVEQEEGIHPPTSWSPDLLLHDKRGIDIWNEDGASRTELTTEQDERLQRLAERLADLEAAGEDQIRFVIQVEQRMAEYRKFYGEWQAQGPPERSLIGLQEFALERLVELNEASFDTEENLKEHVYALGQLAGRTTQQSRALSANLMSSSTFHTPVQQGRGSVAAPPVHSSVVNTAGTPAVATSAAQRYATPGTVSNVDMVNVVERVTDGFKESLEAVVDKFAELHKKKDDDDDGEPVYRSDKVQAISGLEFKRDPPKIRDDDPDLDKYDLAFDNAVACYAFGGRTVRDIDKLHMYGNGFKDGSTRRKVFENCLRAANAAGRLPKEAKELMAEIRKTLRTYIWETAMQKMTRLDREYAALVQGGLSHADFRALWVAKLQDMVEAKMDMPTEHTLFRNYLNKIKAELRVGVMQKDWKLDGQDKPARQPTTHEEVAIAVGQLLEEKADIHAAGNAGADAFFMVDGGAAGGNARKITSGGGQTAGAAVTCGYCQMQDNHYTEECPQKAADWRNEAEQCRKKNREKTLRPDPFEDMDSQRQY